MSNHAHHEHSSSLPVHEIIDQTVEAVVQVVALNKGFFGNVSTAWTGSGTIVDPRGYILTNCHVANPRSMGMPAPKAKYLGISIMGAADEPPALTYLAEIVVQSPQLDLAVLKIVSDANGKGVRGLNLPYIEIGDSDELCLADRLAIFGFPGIGGQTITFTSGMVSGFTGNDKLRLKRAWIKTDATIAGGNSGGTAINSRGQLVGIPTQAAAGDNINPVDARPVDTNKDGRPDAVVSLGGFINGLRPVNIAKPLLSKAGVKVGGRGVRAKLPMQKAEEVEHFEKKIAPSGRAAQFSDLIFCSQISRDNRPVNPSALLPSGTKNVHVVFQYAGMRKGTAWRQVWSHNGKVVLDRNDKWEWESKGDKRLTLSNKRGMPDGEYQLTLYVRNEVVADGRVAIGVIADTQDTQLHGRVVDEKTGRALENALLIALKPNVKVMDFVKVKNKQMAFSSVRSDDNGQFIFPEQFPKGYAYGLVVIARGYKDLVVESGLRIGEHAPEMVEMPPIPLKRD